MSCIRGLDEHSAPSSPLVVCASELMTPTRSLRVGATVYAPQDDSYLLIEALQLSGSAVGARVLDLCTGTGIVALAASAAGAAQVLAFDISPAAVTCARANARAAQHDSVDVRLGTLDDALAHGPYDLVLANPPYVPSPTAAADMAQLAWNAGPDGRAVLDPLCDAAPGLLTPQATMLIVQSEIAGIEHTRQRLERNGLLATVTSRRTVAFGPVMTRRASWLEEVRMLEPGRRTEELVVVTARHRPGL